MRRALLALAFLLATVATALIVTGGFVTSLLGLRVSAQSPRPSAAGAAVALIAWLIAARRADGVRADLRRINAAIAARTIWIAAVIAGAATAGAIAYSTFSAAGSDASGYLSQARMWAGGSLARAEPLSSLGTWADAALTVTPLGWWPAGVVGWQVPTYAPGLPLLMAPLHALGGTVAAALVVPASFGLAIWATAVLARRVGGALAGVMAAVWLATSPVALFAAVQPMSDMPATAAWLACWVGITTMAADRPSRELLLGRLHALLVRRLRSALLPHADFDRRPNFTKRVPSAAWPPPRYNAARIDHTGDDAQMLGDGSARDVSGRALLAAGAAAAAAVLIRPNLAPLAIVPALYVWLAVRAASWHQRLGRATVFALPVVVAGVVVATLQWRWFGSPFRSGYGTAEEIYALANVAPNLTLYFTWLLDVHGPWLLMAPLALLFARRPIAWLLLFAAGVVGAYLVYAEFEVWTYLRFLLPALALAMVAAASVLGAVLARLPEAARMPVLVLVVLTLGGVNVAATRQHGVFRAADLHRAAAIMGPYLNAAMPAHAVVIAGEQSGSVRYYTDRPILRWDAISPEAMAPALDVLTRRGYDVWVVLDEWEEPLVRTRFADLPALALDWPPMAEAGSERRARTWRLRDRAPFHRGGRVITDRLR
ncbi:MAG: hypothetical protein ACT4QD_17665 [Acidobacteriota bacterium]